MLDPHALIVGLGGLAMGSHLQAHGISRAQLANCVRAGRIDRVRPGVFAAKGLHDALHRAALHGGSLTCGEALRRHGVWVLDPDGPPHVWVGRRGRIHEHVGCRCVSHFFRGQPPLGLVDVETALIHLHRCGGDEAFFASFESAWRLRKLSAAARLRIRAALPGYARWLVDFAGPNADSGLESLVRLRLHMVGIVLESQVSLPGVGRVDFLVDGKLILEIDGREHHAGTSERHRDLRRDAAASRLGIETLRFDYAQIVHDWATVLRAVLAAIARTSEHS